MAHDVTVVMGVKILNRKVLHSVEHFFAQLHESALGHNGHQLIVYEAGDQRQDIEERRRPTNPRMRLPTELQSPLCQLDSTRAMTFCIKMAGTELTTALKRMQKMVSGILTG